MSQIGVIVVKDNVNTQAMIDLLKQDPKLTIGKEAVSENGFRYIPIDKKA
jgi:hypothetical protein